MSYLIDIIFSEWEMSRQNEGLVLKFCFVEMNINDYSMKLSSFFYKNVTDLGFQLIPVTKACKI